MKPIRFIFFFLLISSPAAAQVPLTGLLIKLKKATQDTSQVLIVKSIAEYYQNIRPDSAAFFAQQGLTLSGRLNYSFGIAAMNRILGELDMNQGKMDHAMQRFHIALALYQKIGYQPGIAALNNGLGILSARKGSYKDATGHFLTALDIHEKAHNTPGIIQCYIKLGSVNEQTGNLNKALEYFTKGMQLDNNQTPSNATGTLLNNVGIVYLKRKDVHTGLHYFLAGLQKVRDPQLIDVRILLLINAGQAYEQLGDIKKAYRLEKEALGLIRQRHLRELEVNTLVNLASLLGKSKPDSSAVLLRQALAITKEIQQHYVRLDVFQGMVTIYKQQGRYKEAEQTLELKNRLQDSLFTLQKSKEIAELQSNYELARSKLKVQQLNLSNQHTQFNRNVILASGIGVLVLLLVLIVFYMKTHALNKKLTAQKEILKQKKEALDKLNTFKDKLFSIIGHDLRSPISTIVNMLAIFEDDVLSMEEIYLFVPKLKEQSMATLDILDKLLVWGKSQLKGTSYNQSLFNAKELVRKNITLYATGANQKAITLIDHTPDELTLYGDPVHVDFIIRNLLANAIKYTHTGGKVELDAILDRPTGFTTILIRDNGIGIAKEFQQQIFEPYNLSMEGTANEKGNSIGLMLCKEFAEANNGKIEVSSELGQGTQIAVSFPDNSGQSVIGSSNQLRP